MATDTISSTPKILSAELAIHHRLIKGLPLIPELPETKTKDWNTRTHLDTLTATQLLRYVPLPTTTRATRPFLKASRASVGALAKLPGEIMFSIFDHLDIQSVASFKQANAYCYETVANYRPYVDTKHYGSSLIRDLRWAKLLNEYTVKRLHRVLVTRNCSVCQKEFGKYVSMLNLRRYCRWCMDTSHPMALSLHDAALTFGVPEKQLEQNITVGRIRQKTFLDMRVRPDETRIRYVSYLGAVLELNATPETVLMVSFDSAKEYVLEFYGGKKDSMLKVADVVQKDRFAKFTNAIPVPFTVRCWLTPSTTTPKSWHTDPITPVPYVDNTNNRVEFGFECEHCDAEWAHFFQKVARLPLQHRPQPWKYYAEKKDIHARAITHLAQMFRSCDRGAEFFRREVEETPEPYMEFSIDIDAADTWNRQPKRYMQTEI